MCAVVAAPSSARHRCCLRRSHCSHNRTFRSNYLASFSITISHLPYCAKPIVDCRLSNRENGNSKCVSLFSVHFVTHQIRAHSLAAISHSHIPTIIYMRIQRNTYTYNANESTNTIYSTLLYNLQVSLERKHASTMNQLNRFIWMRMSPIPAYRSSHQPLK